MGGLGGSRDFGMNQGTECKEQFLRDCNMGGTRERAL